MRPPCSRGTADRAVADVRSSPVGADPAVLGRAAASASSGSLVAAVARPSGGIRTTPGRTASDPKARVRRSVWETLPGTGTVYTHTTVRRPFPPSTEPESLPLVVVLVEPDGAPGVRVVGNLIEAEPQIGLRVALRVVDGDDRRQPVFAPVTARRAAADERSRTTGRVVRGRARRWWSATSPTAPRTCGGGASRSSGRAGTRTYAELSDRTARLAAVLAGANVREGTRVAILSPNHPDVVETVPRRVAARRGRRAVEHPPRRRRPGLPDRRRRRHARPRPPGARGPRVRQRSRRRHDVGGR